jgi:hypothetical protein
MRKPVPRKFLFLRARTQEVTSRVRRKSCSKTLKSGPVLTIILWFVTQKQTSDMPSIIAVHSSKRMEIAA